MLNAQQQHFIEKAQSKQNIFLTGVAGTGKSFALQQLITTLKKPTAITASTGIAALQIRGTTIHSWAGIRENCTAHQITSAYYWQLKIRPQIKAAHILIIEEVSMLDSALFTLISKVCRIARQSSKPFGGLQVILVGDMCQLPPVKIDRGFPFKSREWWRLKLETIELTESIRQVQKNFVDLLTEVRLGKLSEQSRALLLNRVHAIDPTISGACRLMTHNAQVDTINSQQLRQLPGTVYKYQAKDFYHKSLSTAQQSMFKKKLDSWSLSPAILYLKIGARIMATRNDKEYRFMNGSMGTIIALDTHSATVQFDNNETPHRLTQESWDILEHSLLKASRKQIPLRLAYAITVHKSQGLTLDCVSINLDRAFAPGQSYVALSRCRSLEGLNIEAINFSKIKAHPLAVKFSKGLLKVKYHGTQCAP